jgi:succinate-acetate transporter protein
MALFYGGLAQFLAGMWEFATGNTFGATGGSDYPIFLPSFFGVIARDCDHLPHEMLPRVWSVVAPYLNVRGYKWSPLPSPQLFILGSLWLVHSFHVC